jgi:cob(I)alamin adenosyltransferase
MKKLFLIGLILGLFTFYSYAQMTGQKGETSKGMMGEQEDHMTEQKGMMGQKEMMENMMSMMDQMSEMIGKIPKMLMKLTPPPDIRETMFGIMKDMSLQMMDISKIMEKGEASEEEMKMMKDKMARIQKRMEELEAKEPAVETYSPR